MNSMWQTFQVNYSYNIQEMTYYSTYPSLMKNTEAFVANPFLPGPDIAQIELNIGRILPFNLLTTAAAKVKSAIDLPTSGR